jgi:hypothetical protein
VSSIDCTPAGGIWIDGKPDKDTLEKYKTYYAIQERSTGSDGLDTFYALVSLVTGQDMQVDGRDFRIRGIKAAAWDDFSSGYDMNLDLANDGAIKKNYMDGKSVYKYAAKVCNQYIGPKGEVIYDCWEEIFEYVAVPFQTILFPSETEFIPYFWTMPAGKSNIPVAVSNNGTPQLGKDDFAVCIQIDPDGTGPLTGVKNTTSPYIIDSVALGADSVIDCHNPTEKFYYLMLLEGQSPPSRSDYKYMLVYYDGSKTRPAVKGSCSDGVSADVFTCIKKQGGIFRCNACFH